MRSSAISAGSRRVENRRNGWLLPLVAVRLPAAPADVERR